MVVFQHYQPGGPAWAELLTVYLNRHLKKLVIMSHSFNRDLYYVFLLLKDVDECSIRPNVCKNGGTCTNAFGGYSCICVNGWTGKNCETNFDDCAGAACLNGNSFLLLYYWIN